jgi:hypothetical protein
LGKLDVAPPKFIIKTNSCLIASGSEFSRLKKKENDFDVPNHEPGLVMLVKSVPLICSASASQQWTDPSTTRQKSHFSSQIS